MSIAWSFWIAAAPGVASLGGVSSAPPAGAVDPIDLWLKVGAVVIAFLGVVAAWIKLSSEFVQTRARKKLERSSGYYTQEQLKRATRYYVPPGCSNLDPSSEAEPKNHFAVQENLFGAMDRFLSESSTDRHLLLLADSGMGKSSCLINYYVRNQRRWGRRRHRIALVPLGIPNADALIRRLERKNEAVLFLDAFDEDTKAITDHRARLDQLMKLSAEYRRVVVTCRTQFFLKEEDVPDQTGILRVEPRPGGKGGGYEFLKIYLSPLSNTQVETFLRKRFGLLHGRERRQARRLVEAVPNLSVRPMLLAFIPDLLESGQAASTKTELYESLVESWCQREKTWVDPTTLRRFSEQLAVDLFARRAERGAERISADDLHQLAEKWAIRLDAWQLTGRSLLNRDAAGNFKFAHRSMMEFLVADQILKGNVTAQRAEWTDEVGSFVAQALMSAKSRRSAASRIRLSVLEENEHNFSVEELREYLIARSGVALERLSVEEDSVDDIIDDKVLAAALRTWRRDGPPNEEKEENSALLAAVRAEILTEDEIREALSEGRIVINRNPDHAILVKVVREIIRADDRPLSKEFKLKEVLHAFAAYDLVSEIRPMHLTIDEALLAPRGYLGRKWIETGDFCLDKPLWIREFGSEGYQIGFASMAHRDAAMHIKEAQRTLERYRKLIRANSAT